MVARLLSRQKNQSCSALSGENMFLTKHISTFYANTPRRLFVSSSLPVAIILAVWLFVFKETPMDPFEYPSFDITGGSSSSLVDNSDPGQKGVIKSAGSKGTQSQTIKPAISGGELAVASAQPANKVIPGASSIPEGDFFFGSEQPKPPEKIISPEPTPIIITKQPINEPPAVKLLDQPKQVIVTASQSTDILTVAPKLPDVVNSSGDSDVSTSAPVDLAKATPGKVVGPGPGNGDVGLNTDKVTGQTGDPNGVKNGGVQNGRGRAGDLSFQLFYEGTARKLLQAPNIRLPNSKERIMMTFSLQIQADGSVVGTFKKGNSNPEIQQLIQAALKDFRFQAQDLPNNAEITFYR